MRRVAHFLRWWLADTRERYREFRAAESLPRPLPGVRVISPGNLELGPEVAIDPGTYIHCGDMDWCRGMGRVAIGRGSYVGPQCVLFGMAGIEIGEWVMLSPHVVVSSVQHPYHDLSSPMYQQERVYGKVCIESDVYLGSGVVVTPGVTIHKGAVIGAGAVVTSDIPANAIALGVPAKVVAYRDALEESGFGGGLGEAPDGSGEQESGEEVNGQEGNG